MTTTATQTVRAEHVGSLLRPKELLEARNQFKDGKLSAQALRELEDKAALDAIALQKAAGVEVLTDGEVRRGSWMAGLLESLGGVSVVSSDFEHWKDVEGNDVSREETDYDHLAVSGELTQEQNLTSDELKFLAEHADGPHKITMVSASMGGMLWNQEISPAAYPHPGAMLAALVELQAKEIERLIDEGLGWLQLDSLSYTRVIDPEFGGIAPGNGESPGEVLQRIIDIDDSLVQRAKQRNPDVTVGMHICRGNNRSAWLAKGSYEPVAEQLFNGVGVDRFLLEFDTDRAGGFEPLRFVPAGKTVVLGLVSTKVPELEDQDELLRRVDEASKYVDVEYLAVSPQCGFASTAQGNRVTVDDERRKLELVASTAQRVWG